MPDNILGMRDKAVNKTKCLVPEFLLSSGGR